MARASTPNPVTDAIKLSGPVILFLTAASGALMLALSSWTGSAAITAHAIGLIAAATSQCIMIAGTSRRQKKQEDARNDPIKPHTSANDALFWSYVMGILVYALAAGLALNDGLQALGSPRTNQNTTVALITLFMTLGIAGVITANLLAQYERTRDDERHHEPDQAAHSRSSEPVLVSLIIENIGSIATCALAAIGILGAIANITSADGVIAILISVVLGAIAAVMASQTRTHIIALSALLAPSTPKTQEKHAPAGTSEKSPKPTTPATAQSPATPQLSRKERKRQKNK